MITRSSDQKQFIEMQDVLVELDADQPSVYMPTTKTAEWSYQLSKTGQEPVEKEKLSTTSRLENQEGQEITLEEAVQLLEEPQNQSVTSHHKTFLPGEVNPNQQNAEPSLYSPEENQMSSEGEEIPEIDQYIQKHREESTDEFLDGFFQTLYDEWDIRHSTDVSSKHQVENTEIESYDENAKETIQSSKHGFCGELLEIVNYALRNKGVPSGQQPGNWVLRYDTDKDGLTIPDSDGDQVVEHGFNYFENEDGELEKIDLSIYMHLREADMDHEEAYKFSKNRDEVYLLENKLRAPYQGKISQELDHLEFTE